MTERISTYAEQGARADYQEQKQKNCIPRSTRAFRQHVEQRVARFLLEGHVFYQSVEPPITMTQQQFASAYNTLYVATYNELRRADKVHPGDKVNWLHKLSGAHGDAVPVAGIVIGETPKRVRIAVYNEQRKDIEERLAYPAALTPRVNHTELDDAMEQAKRDAAPFLEALGVNVEA